MIRRTQIKVIENFNDQVVWEKHINAFMASHEDSEIIDTHIIVTPNDNYLYTAIIAYPVWVEDEVKNHG